MNGKRYSLHARPSKRSRTGEVYYVQFKLADGSYSTAKSSGQVTEGAAKTWADNYLASGQVVTQENVTFGSFAADFFNWEGDYAKHKRKRGKRITERQLYEQTLHLNNHVLPWFKNMKLTRIDYQAINNFQIAKLDAGLSGGTVNKLTGILKAILEHALREKLIQSMPLIERVGDQPKERGVLAVEEVKRVLFEVKWPEYRCYVANLTAAFTGLRQGEVIALQRQDVRDSHLHVRHSYNETWGLKETKTRKVRNVALIPILKAHLEQLLQENPFSDPDAFVFYSYRPDKPINSRIVTEALYQALEAIGIDSAARTTRRVDFHSWRHFFNSLLLNNGIGAEKVRSLTGHSTTSMTERYFHASEFDDVVKVLERVVTPIEAVEGTSQTLTGKKDG